MRPGCCWDSIAIFLRRRRTVEPSQEADSPLRQDIRIHEKDGRVRDLEVGDGLPLKADADNGILEMCVEKEKRCSEDIDPVSTNNFLRGLFDDVSGMTRV